MIAEFPEQLILALTELQRVVLDKFEFDWELLSAGEIRGQIKQDISLKTIRRALKKLCDIGIIERLPAKKKGRGYSNLYRVREEYPPLPMG